MTILGIETSCDETGAAVAKLTPSGLTLLSNSLSSSLAKHAATGGIIPEVAAREQVKFILPVIDEALQKGLGVPLSSKPPVDAIAVTHGPGLIGSLLVGVETAKTLSMIWDVPVIPVNHMYGHIYANFYEHPEISLPSIALVVSGGHTDLLLLKEHHHIQVLGGTRDDAAGEAFDKIGRLLGLSYPAGPQISKLAEKGNPKAYPLPRPMIGSGDLNFSFSGLKTAVLNLIKKNNWDFQNEEFRTNNFQLLSDLCASVEYTIVAVLTRKTVQAAKEQEISTVLVSGGVAANSLLRKTLESALLSEISDAKLFIPSPYLCTDNGAMIAAAGAFSNQQVSWENITADPELYY